MMECPSCGNQEYPVLCPAVIVGITNGDKIILSKYEGRRFKRYALIAGFAEIGETIEETVHREVMEEVGLKVKNLRYYKSQPWSFSGTLLFGFFCDVDGDDTLTVDHEELSMAQWIERDKIPDARVVMLAHLYGTPAKMDEIIEVCRKHNAVIIEDAAEALSASYKDKACGTFGKYNVFSFNGNKIITTSGGGMLITETEDERNKALFWATQSRENEVWYQHEEIGYNYRMSNVVAGIGRGQLKHLEEHRNLKREIYEHYKEGLKDLPVKMNPYLEETTPNFWLSCILIDEDCKVKPMDILHRLNKANIESRPLWKPMHMQPVFKGHDFVTVEERAVNEDLFARGLCLPSDIKMTKEEQDSVIDIIKECFEG